MTPSERLQNTAGIVLDSIAKRLIAEMPPNETANYSTALNKARLRHPILSDIYGGARAVEASEAALAELERQVALGDAEAGATAILAFTEKYAVVRRN